MSRYPQPFGPFVLAQSLGFGGSGDVSLALLGHAGVERVCVVKRLHRDLRDVPEVLQRFRREAELAPRLVHDNLVRAVQVGEVEGEPYIAQEFVEGKDLAQLTSALASTPDGVPVELCFYIAREVSLALAFAHELGGMSLVHRDVSPANIRLGFNGDVKLIDFGIAKAARHAHLTQRGQRPPGRRSYMAPEILRGRPGDAQADVYALGVVLLGAARPPPGGVARQHGYATELPRAFGHQQRHHARHGSLGRESHGGRADGKNRQRR